MYRIRHIKSVKEWVFMCEICLLSVKEGNKFYQCGGPGKVNLPKFAI